MTRLVHFTHQDSPLEKIVLPPYGPPDYGQPEAGTKPDGLWVSDEDGYGWSAWCRENNFPLDNGRGDGGRYRTDDVAYEIELAPKARILRLTSVGMLEWFTAQYKADTPQLPDCCASDDGRKWEGCPGLDCPDNPERNYPGDDAWIKWHRVARRYAGVIISPYQPFPAGWYSGYSTLTWPSNEDILADRGEVIEIGHLYAWGCASGCIWDSAAIASFTEVPITDILEPTP